MKDSSLDKLNNIQENEIDEYIDEFLSYLKFIKRRADSTIYEYRKILNKYKKFVLKYGLTRTCFLKYLEHISNLSQRTIKLRIVVLRSFLNYLYENGEISGNRYWKDANASVPSEIPKGLTEEQLEILFSVIDNEFDKIFFNLLATVGLRISEALHLRVDDIIFHKNYAELIIYGKGNKQRILKISKEYAEELVKFENGKEYLFSNKEDFPFTSRTMERRFKNYVIKANKKIEKLITDKKMNINYINATPHALRHTCAKRLLNSGKNIEEVRYILGHTTISTTGIYVRADNHSSLLDEI
ncbi:MAG: tyrosine-type recombinase/integrase [Defluviitoga tunisiensis]